MFCMINPSIKFMIKVHIVVINKYKAKLCFAKIQNEKLNAGEISNHENPDTKGM